MCNHTDVVKRLLSCACTIIILCNLPSQFMIKLECSLIEMIYKIKCKPVWEWVDDSMDRRVTKCSAKCNV